MELVENLILLLERNPYSKDIKSMIDKVEASKKINLSQQLNRLDGIWELRWSSSKAPFLNYNPLLNNLQILETNKSRGINLLKPRGLQSIAGTGITAKLALINDIRVSVTFTGAGIIGPRIFDKKIQMMAKIRKEQKGWLDITYLNENIRICKGDKGTTFALLKRNNNILLDKFKTYMNSICFS